MARIFDFHTHILPGIDDGSKSVEESMEMIHELFRQGARGIAATPHFYADKNTPEHFFEKRNAAWEKLMPHLGDMAPNIRLGAEVHYFEGMQRAGNLEDFCLEGTKLFLLEMPTCSWTSRMVETVLDLNDRSDIILLLAHIERYQSHANKKAFDAFYREHILMQVSTGYFIEKPRAAMKMLERNEIHFLGTDAHNMTSRRPDLGKALEIIEKKKGGEFLRRMNEREKRILNSRRFS